MVGGSACRTQAIAGERGDSSRPAIIARRARSRNKARGGVGGVARIRFWIPIADTRALVRLRLRHLLVADSWAAAPRPGRLLFLLLLHKKCAAVLLCVLPRNRFFYSCELPKKKRGRSPARKPRTLRALLQHSRASRQRPRCHSAREQDPRTSRDDQRRNRGRAGNQRSQPPSHTGRAPESHPAETRTKRAATRDKHSTPHKQPSQEQRPQRSRHAPQHKRPRTRHRASKPQRQNQPRSRTRTRNRNRRHSTTPATQRAHTQRSHRFARARGMCKGGGRDRQLRGNEANHPAALDMRSFTPRPRGIIQNSVCVRWGSQRGNSPLII